MTFGGGQGDSSTAGTMACRSCLPPTTHVHEFGISVGIDGATAGLGPKPAWWCGLCHPASGMIDGDRYFAKLTAADAAMADYFGYSVACAYHRGRYLRRRHTAMTALKACSYLQPDAKFSATDTEYCDWFVVRYNRYLSPLEERDRE